VLRRQAEVLRAAVVRHHAQAGAGSGVGLMTQ
jgi:hypothetical protein